MKKLIRIAAAASFAFACLTFAGAQATKTTAPAPKAQTSVTSKSTMQSAKPKATVAKHHSTKKETPSKSPAKAKHSTTHKLRTNHGGSHAKAVSTQWHVSKAKSIPAPKTVAKPTISSKPKSPSNHGKVQRK